MHRKYPEGEAAGKMIVRPACTKDAPALLARGF